jgi:preprotein translocase subunit SecD
MKNPINKKNNHRITPWLLALVIILMSISALPNLYQNNTVIKIHANDKNLSANTVTESLTQAGLTVHDISAIHQTGEIRVLLENPKLSVKAQALLQDKFKLDDVTVHSEATTPPWLRSINLTPLKLGLDLNGGVLFVLKVETDKAIDERFEKLRITAKEYRIEHKLRGINIGPIINNSILITVIQSKHNQINAFIQTLKEDYPNIVAFEQTYKTHSEWRLTFDEKSQKKIASQAIEQAISTLRSRIEQLGITEAVTQRQGKHYIRIELPGVQDPSAAKRLIGATAQLSFHALKEQGGQQVTYKNGGTVKLNPLPIFTGNDIESAQAGRDQSGQPLVELMLSPSGGDKMRQFSRKNIGNPMSTLYVEYYKNSKQEVMKKQEVISVATIQQVLSRKFSITGLGTMQQAQELAMILRAGSLQAPITIVEEHTIGPSLGEQNIKDGFNALKLGLAITLLFMLFCYGRLGFVAVFALIINLVCLLGLMSLLPGVVLTLPGIAGFVLTIGMAVDSNVIIFERVRDEIKLGASTITALKRGYEQAMSSIIDANLTTMITALVLLSVGYGPIKGFAITLALGILTSLFSGVLVSSYLSPIFIIKDKQTNQHKLTNKKGNHHA